MMNHWMFRCKDVSQKVSQSMDTRLPWHQRMAIETHLLMCRYCARFRSQLLTLRDMSREIDTPATTNGTATGLSTESKEKIKQALRNQS